MPLPVRPRRRLLAAVLAGGALALLAGAATAPVASAEATVGFVKRVDGLAEPTQVTSARDGSGRLFVTERAGRVRVVRNGRLVRRPFLNIEDLVGTTGEGGLLSIAFHPDYATHPYLWVAYTDPAGDLRVARFRARGPAADRVAASTRRPVLRVPHPDRYSNHYAGQLAFGRAGYLYLSTGDGGGRADPRNRAQNVRSLQGKILRLQVLRARATCGRLFCVPPGNPYAGPVPGRGLVWASGLRNPRRFSVDPRTGDLWVGDVGENRFEEVDRIPAAAGGANLGWPCLEGTTTYDASRCTDENDYLEPEWTYGRDVGATVVGGFVYRGSAYAGPLGGRYLGGDFRSGRILVGGSTGLVTLGQLDRVTSFGEDDDREIWAVTLDGGLYELTAGGSA